MQKNQKLTVIVSGELKEFSVGGGGDFPTETLQASSFPSQSNCLVLVS